MPEEMNTGLVLSESDYKKLSHLVDISRSTATYELDMELAKADICADEQLPATVVALYDKVHFRDVENNSRRAVTIVMPWQSNITEMRISILSPVGIALIGEPLGKIIRWPLLNGKFSELEVVEITRQPVVARRQ